MICSIICSFLSGAIVLTAITLALGWWQNSYFKRRNVASPPAYLPFIGNMMGLLTRTEHFRDFVHRLYTDFPSEKYVGFNMLTKPILMLRDIDLIKLISIKEFDHFQDRGAGMSEDADPIFGRSIMSLQGQKWKDMRSTLSPAFTSSKIKGMLQFIIDSGGHMASHYQKTTNTCINRVRGIIEIEMKDAYTRYTTDVIANCAFGLQVNSFDEKENQFYMVGKDVTDFTGLRFFKMLCLGVFSKITKIFGIHFLDQKTADFFRSLVWDTIKERETNNIIRPDMLHLLNEAKKGNLKRDSDEDDKDDVFAAVDEPDIGLTNVKRAWTDDEIVAQAVLFLIAGFDTTSTSLSFLTHELALNPQIQKRLQKEIDEVAWSVNGSITYELLQSMKYLDMVVSEALRKWPPSANTDRKCTKEFTLPPPNDSCPTGFQMKPGDVLWIPTYGIHHDPQYWKDPEVFDPERFSDENKQNIVPGSYMPFGMGPRNCIGSRFALVELKAIIYNLLLRFDFMTTAKTQNPIKLNLQTLSMHSERGFWIGLRPRFKRLPSNQIDIDC